MLYIKLKTLLGLTEIHFLDSVKTKYNFYDVLKNIILLSLVTHEIALGQLLLGWQRLKTHRQSYKVPPCVTHPPFSLPGLEQRFSKPLHHALVCFLQTILALTLTSCVALSKFLSHLYLKLLLCQMGIIIIVPILYRVAVKHELTYSAENIWNTVNTIKCLLLFAHSADATAPFPHPTVFFQ